MLNFPFPVAVAQMRPDPGNIRANLAQILQKIEQARQTGIKLLVFPEQCVPGYLLGDRWEIEPFLCEIESANEQIRAASSGMIVVWGSTKVQWDKIGEDGRVRKYNAAFIACDGVWVPNGRFQGWIPKTNLPKYRIFDDARHFYPAAQLATEMNLALRNLLLPFRVMLDGHRITLALTVCEDLWEDEYNDKPSIIYKDRDAHLLIDISCSPWTAGKWRARERMLKNRVQDSGLPILYVNAVGLQNNGRNLVWFDGDSALIDNTGPFRWRAPQHEEGLFIVSASQECASARPSEIREIRAATVHAMRAFYQSFPRVLIGLSGGIDSAVALALLVEALGPQKLLAVNMPTQYNSNTTKQLAETCAQNFGVEYIVVPIQDIFEANLAMLAGARYVNPKMLVLENIQGRIRGSTLATLSAAEEGVYTCNGNKTEMALNYFTLYGDGSGAAAFLADLWKGQIYALAKMINEDAGWDIIPQGIIDIIPSAELSADQNVDEGKGDPIFYPFHDPLLRAFMEWRWDSTTVVSHLLDGTLEQKLGCETGTLARYFRTRADLIANIEWAWRQYNIEYKRVQTPPVFITSRRAFGFDRRDTIAPGYVTDAFLAFAQQYLQGGEKP